MRPFALLSSLRWYVVNMLRWSLASRTPKGERPTVLFDLRRNPWHRYLHILIIFFQQSGYRVLVRHRYRAIACWGSSELFKLSPDFSLVFASSDAKDTLVITDGPSGHRKLHLTADYHDLPGETRDGFHVPMPLMYSQYLKADQWHRAAEPLPKRERCVFFFGNMDPSAYDRVSELHTFGCYTRIHLIGLLKARFAQHVQFPTDLSLIGVEADRYVVLMDRSRSHIPAPALLATLRRFDFFLALSGVVMPLCHNVVEAMCAGCIPILQYPHLMEPPLEHGVNCLSYTNEEELLAVLARVPYMSDAEVAALRKNVCDHYDRYLTPGKVVDRIVSEAARGGILRLNAELESTRILQERIAAKEDPAQ
jgi:hypothetical protein